MPRLTVRFVFFFAILALIGCKTPNVGNDVALESNKGVAIGSITYSGLFAGYRLYYRQVGGGNEGLVEYGNAALPRVGASDIAEPGLRGGVFSVALTPGEYEVYRWTVDQGSIHAKSSDQSAVRFRVEAGKGIYLGNFYFDRRGSRADPKVTGITFRNSDESIRDLAIFKRKHPNLAGVEVSSTLQPGTYRADLGPGWVNGIVVPGLVPGR